MANPTGKGGFGDRKQDINKNGNGRPKDFNGLRELAQAIAHESLPSNDKVTVVQAIMRKWAGSNDARLQMAFVKVCYGEAPTDLSVKVSGEIGVKDAGAIADRILGRLDSLAARAGAPEATNGVSENTAGAGSS